MSVKDPRFDPRKVQKDVASKRQKLEDIERDSIDTDHVLNKSITNEKLADGCVTPNKLASDWPVFYAWAAGGLSSSVTGRFGDSGLPIFNQIRVNSGNYSTTTGRFTAPYTGIYEFHFAVIHRYGTGAGSLELTFYIDQANASPRAFSYSQVGYSGDHDWVHTHAILSLNAGQYVQCGIYACSSTTNYYYGENLGYFSGKQIR